MKFCSLDFGKFIDLLKLVSTASEQLVWQLSNYLLFTEVSMTFLKVLNGISQYQWKYFKNTYLWKHSTFKHNVVNF